MFVYACACACAYVCVVCLRFFLSVRTCVCTYVYVFVQNLRACTLMDEYACAFDIRMRDHLYFSFVFKHAPSAYPRSVTRWMSC